MLGEGGFLTSLEIWKPRSLLGESSRHFGAEEAQGTNPTMRAKIRHIFSPDIENLETWYPEDPDRFGFLLELIIGPADEEGEELFTFEVCTPQWLRERRETESAVFGHHRILVFDYDYRRIRQMVEGLVERTRGESWTEVATKLNRYATWEFEDYSE